MLLLNSMIRIKNRMRVKIATLHLCLQLLITLQRLKKRKELRQFTLLQNLQELPQLSIVIKTNNKSLYQKTSMQAQEHSFKVIQIQKRMMKTGFLNKEIRQDRELQKSKLCEIERLYRQFMFML